MERHAQSEYDFFWAEKYDYCRVEEEDFLAELMAIEKQRKTDALFREGQGASPSELSHLNLYMD
jgi:hypothetical protein